MVTIVDFGAFLGPDLKSNMAPKKISFKSLSDESTYKLDNH